MITLGINAAFHDSSATLVIDGVVVAAAEEERFTHVKHAKRPVPFSSWELPFHAIDYCLREACKSLADVDHGRRLVRRPHVGREVRDDERVLVVLADAAYVGLSHRFDPDGPLRCRHKLPASALHPARFDPRARLTRARSTPTVNGFLM